MFRCTGRAMDEGPLGQDPEPRLGECRYRHFISFTYSRHEYFSSSSAGRLNIWSIRLCNTNAENSEFPPNVYTGSFRCVLSVKQQAFLFQNPTNGPILVTKTGYILFEVITKFTLSCCIMQPTRYPLEDRRSTSGLGNIFSIWHHVHTDSGVHSASDHVYTGAPCTVSVSTAAWTSTYNRGYE